MQHDRRAHPRTAILGDLRGEIVVLQRMHVRELSPEGATIETDFPLQPESIHEVRLTLRDLSVSVRVHVINASVADVDQDVVTYRTGVQFVAPSAAAQHAVAEFIRHLERTRTTEAD